MANQASAAITASETLPAAQVYGMAVICLAAGLAIGYLVTGTQPQVAGPKQVAGIVQPSAPRGATGGGDVAGMEARSARPVQQPAGATARSPHAGAMSGAGRMPSPAEMKQMADKQAAPLVEKLKNDPKNTAVLMQVGVIYQTTGQFKQAAGYYEKAVEIEPGSVKFRTEYASCMYRGGDVDSAIAELNKALSYDPKDANALFNLGLIRLQGKRDGKGAVAAWQKLLKDNPQLSADRRAQVQKLMADVMTTLAQDQK